MYSYTSICTLLTFTHIFWTYIFMTTTIWQADGPRKAEGWDWWSWGKRSIKQNYHNYRNFCLWQTSGAACKGMCLFKLCEDMCRGCGAHLLNFGIVLWHSLLFGTQMLYSKLYRKFQINIIHISQKCNTLINNHSINYKGSE